jgi:photosystem II stability/assembly factor-like uncharacterized protein
MRSIVAVAVCLCVAGCAAFPNPNALPSPGSLAPTVNVASRGSVYFVSRTVAWELTQPPDRVHTVILQTTDGGSHWRVWGIAPEPGTPVVLTATDVMLSHDTHLLRSSDGSNWTVRTMPAVGTPKFLPDMQHGWLGGFPIYFPAAPSPTAVPGKGGGGGGTTGKGGGGGGATGKGGSPAGLAPCQDKGCAPIALWSTADGGVSWRLLWQSIVSVNGGAMYFLSPTVGMIEQGLTILLSRDGGLTWRPQSFSIPGATADQPATELAPTMFDATHGVLPIDGPNGVYLSRTADGGLTWSPPQRINDCLPCNGSQMVFVDDQHWIDYSKGVYFTADAGQTWIKATTTNPEQTANAVELVAASSPLAVALAPGLFASETTDWGAHWHAVKLPDIYPTYTGFDGQGGWSGG